MPAEHTCTFPDVRFISWVWVCPTCKQAWRYGASTWYKVTLA